MSEAVESVCYPRDWIVYGVCIHMRCICKHVYTRSASKIAGFCQLWSGLIVQCNAVMKHAVLHTVSRGYVDEIWTRC